MLALSNACHIVTAPSVRVIKFSLLTRLEAQFCLFCLQNQLVNNTERNQHKKILLCKLKLFESTDVVEDSVVNEISPIPREDFKIFVISSQCLPFTKHNLIQEVVMAKASHLFSLGKMQFPVL